MKNINTEEVILTWGLSPNDAEGLFKSVCDQGLFDATRHVFVSEDAMEENLVAYVQKYLENPEPLEKALVHPLKIFIMMLSDLKKAMTIMDTIKRDFNNPSMIIFAMATETSREWTLKAYITELSREHEYMKTHHPTEVEDYQLNSLDHS